VVDRCPGPVIYGVLKPFSWKQYVVAKLLAWLSEMQKLRTLLFETVCSSSTVEPGSVKCGGSESLLLIQCAVAQLWSLAQ
jgi:hypothetical protein